MCNQYMITYSMCNYKYICSRIYSKSVQCCSFVCVLRTHHFELDNRRAHPWRKRILPLSVIVDCLQPFTQEWGLVKFAPFALIFQAVLPLCRSCLGNHCVQISWVQLSRHMQKTVSCTGVLALWCYDLSFHLQHKEVSLMRTENYTSQGI